MTVFLRYLDLAKILLLGLEGIKEKILEMSACLSLVVFEVGVDFLLNWDETHYLKVLLLSLAISLFYPDSYIAMMNSMIWWMFLAILLPNSCSLMNVAIFCRKHTIFFVLQVRNLLIPNKKIRAKLLSHSYRSAGWLAWYGMTNGSKF